MNLASRDLNSSNHPMSINYRKLKNFNIKNRKQRGNVCSKIFMGHGDLEYFVFSSKYFNKYENFCLGFEQKHENRIFFLFP